MGKKITGKKKKERPKTKWVKIVQQILEERKKIYNLSDKESQ